MEDVKNVAKAALEKLFNPTIDMSDPENPTVIPLTAEEIEALKLLVSIRGLLPSLDAVDAAILQDASGNEDIRPALVELARIAVDRLFMTVYGV